MMASLATVITLLFAVVLEMHLASSIVSSLTGRPAWLLFLMLAGIGCFYAAVGGYWGVVVTDISQAAFLFVSLLALPVVALSHGATATPYHANYSISLGNLLGDIGWHNIASIVVFGIGWSLVTMDTWQRSSSCRHFDTARSGVIVSGVIMALFAAGWGFAGVYDKLAISQLNLAGFSQGFDPISDILLLAPSAGQLARVALGVLAAGLVMAAISTADTFFIICGHSLVSDVIVGGLKKSNYEALSPAHNLALTDVSRGVIVGFWALAVIIWLILKQVGLLASALSLFFAAYSVQYALLPALLYARRSRQRAGPACWSIASGVIAALVCGLGSALILQYSPTLIILISADKWLALTPVIAVVVSGLVFVVTSLIPQGGTP
jgi:Na+/proline symporter